MVLFSSIGVNETSLMSDLQIKDQAPKKRLFSAQCVAQEAFLQVFTR
jgi:hypothetical protein